MQIQLNEGYRKYPWDRMEIGDFFEVANLDYKARHSLISARLFQHKTTDRRYQVLTGPAAGIVRVVRIDPNAADPEEASEPLVGYKILATFDFDLTSPTCLGGQTLYKKNEPTFPNKNHGPLTVYESLGTAQRSLRQAHKMGFPAALYEVEYLPSAEKRVWYPLGHKKFVRAPLRSLKRGTKLAAWVRLIREIE